MLGLNLPVAQGIDVLGNARVHVGGRWHPGIFAATGGTPLVGMGANTHKMATLMQQLHPDEPVFEARSLARHVDAIVSRAKAQVDAGSALRAQVLERAAAMRARVEARQPGFRRKTARGGSAGVGIAPDVVLPGLPARQRHPRLRQESDRHGLEFHHPVFGWPFGRAAVAWNVPISTP